MWTRGKHKHTARRPYLNSRSADNTWKLDMKLANKTLKEATKQKRIAARQKKQES